MTNVTDVAGISSSMTYDTNNWVSSLTTPYGTTSFAITDSGANNIAPDGRSILITQPDGGHQLYASVDSAPGIAGAYATNEIPDTSGFASTLETTNLNVRNTFYWGPRQYANLSTTNLTNFTTNDFRKARMNHWLRAPNASIGRTISMSRDPSPDSGGAVEGQKTWYDFAGKTNNSYEGTQVEPLFVGLLLADGTTRSTRYERNNFGAVTREIETLSGGLRTNTFVYGPNEIDLLCTTNAMGIQVSSNVYNAYHQVATNYNALNEATVYTYDNSQRLSTMTAPSGLVTSNVYGIDGFLAQEIVVDFSTNSYTYTNALVATHTDPRDLSTTNTYDNLQRVLQSSDPRGTVFYTYSRLDLVRVVDRMGITNSYSYDSMRRRTNEVNGIGAITIYSYCSCGSLDSIRDAAGNYTYFFYDNFGRQVAAAYPDGYSTTNIYNLIGQITSTVDSSGTHITNWFNNQGLRVAVSNAFGRVQSSTYDILDRLTNRVDANGVTIAMTYDSLNRIRTRNYPDGGVESFGYAQNISGVTSYTNQLNQVTRYVYDAASRKTAETNANLEVAQFNYNGASDLLTLTDAKNQITTWNYDQFGRATNKVDAANNILFVYKFDANDRLTNRWSAAKGGTTYNYDNVGNLTNIAYPVSPPISIAYDLLNRMTNMVDAVGTTAYNYDSAGQLLTEDGPWASDTLNYTYQNRLRTGLSLSAPNASTWTQSYGYDAAKRLKSLSSPAGTFNYSYLSPISQLPSAILLPNGAYITNTYDSLARLTGTFLKNSGNSVLNSHQYTYNLGGQNSQQVFTAGNTMDYTYDSIGQLKTDNGKESGGATNRLHEQLGYAYDAAGNLNFRTNNALVQTFNLNSLNELITVNRSGSLTVAGTTTSQATNVTVNTLAAELYADATFARSNFTLVNGTTNFTAVASDILGRRDTNTVTVNLAATNVFAYDLNGNMLTNGAEVMVWNDENELVTNYVAASWKSEFVYDGKFRRRIERDYTWNGSSWTQTNETRFIYDANVIVQHRDANNLPSLTLTRGRDLSGSLQGAGGIGGLLAMTENKMFQDVHSYYHADGNGNVTCLISTNQVIVARAEYDPFGNFIALCGSKATVNGYWFSSKPIHWPSGKYDFLLRWYAANLHRWINRDPLEEAGGYNLYQFVFNNPVTSVDTDGRDTNQSVWWKPQTWPIFRPKPSPNQPAPTPEDPGKGHIYIGPKNGGGTNIPPSPPKECTPYVPPLIPTAPAVPAETNQSTQTPGFENSPDAGHHYIPWWDKGGTNKPPPQP